MPECSALPPALSDRINADLTARLERLLAQADDLHFATMSSAEWYAARVQFTREHAEHLAIQIVGPDAKADPSFVVFSTRSHSRLIRTRLDLERTLDRLRVWVNLRWISDLDVSQRWAELAGIPTRRLTREQATVNRERQGYERRGGLGRYGHP